jgi:hypothetical protein
MFKAYPDVAKSSEPEATPGSSTVQAVNIRYVDVTIA